MLAQLIGLWWFGLEASTGVVRFCAYINDVSLVQHWTLDSYCVQPLIAPSYSACEHAIILITSLYLVQVWLGGSAVCDVLITMALTFIVSTQFATRNRLT